MKTLASSRVLYRGAFLFYFLTLLISYSPQSQATSQKVIDLFNILKGHPQNYEVFGTVCEEVARLRLYKEFPSSLYHITTGIEYGTPTRVIGELDVIIFRKSDKEAILIGEVKCWKNLKSARKKANIQLTRFINTIKKNTPLLFRDATYKNHIFYREQFDEHPDLIAVSQSDPGAPQLFDLTIGIDLAEATELRSLLLTCQQRGKCPTLNPALRRARSFRD